ncbi:MAG: DUF1674 domain-containing protein [Parvularculaceae bacterium]
MNENADEKADGDGAEIVGAAPGVSLTPAARRALLEAAERRRKAAADLPPEEGGPKGLEPTRYGDWERKGRAVDF